MAGPVSLAEAGNSLELINFPDQTGICRHLFRVALELASLDRRPGFTGAQKVN